MMADVNQNARLFDIQRGSAVDGPGLRTTVFFKGCNLKCAWCHNPEGQKFHKELMFHRNRCSACGTCARVCPHQLTSCDLCGKCADYCPHGAREVIGYEMLPDEIYQIIEKDRAYYENSGGGVTFSGGECMLQIDVLTDLLILCRKGGVHTAVDTAGCVPWAYFERVAPYTDLYLYDLKCADEALHIKYTGASNQLILSNLRRLAEKDPRRIIVRIPVIPGFNTTRAELQAMADILRNLDIQKVELLPYHKMGNHKFDALEMQYQEFDVPSDQDMEMFRQYFNWG